MSFTFSVEDLSFWAPGIETTDDRESWAAGRKKIERSTVSPPLEHMSKVSKRRLSQLSRMVLEAGHHLLADREVGHILLCSAYGEICRQYKITRGLLENGEIRPADFSLSVFNTPLSLLSIEEKAKGSVNVLLAGEKTLAAGLQSMTSHGVCCPDERQLILFADELLPEEYETLAESPSVPYAFGFIINPDNRGESSDPIEFSLKKAEASGEVTMPLDLLRWLLKRETRPLRIPAGTSQEIILQRK